MKRVKAACLEQTLHFELKEELGHASAVRAVKEEYDNYRRQLERRRTKYRIVSETTLPDDSILVQVRKQVNGQEVGDYLD